MKKFLLSILFTSLLSTMSLAATGAWDGWVSDERCGAKIDPECTKTCMKQGAKLVFVDSKDKSVVHVANGDKLKGFEGQHVKVKGSLDKGILTVSSIEAAGK